MLALCVRIGEGVGVVFLTSINYKIKRSLESDR